MNYEKFSDAELNQTLTGILFKLDQWDLADSGRCFFMEDAKGELHIQPVVSYCTDWTATMPLSIEHKVNIQWALNDNFMVSCRNVYGRSAPTQGDLSTNPLRAIVICLIKVLESKQ